MGISPKGRDGEAREGTKKASRNRNAFYYELIGEPPIKE
jgi:hypothetical protein